MKRYYVEERFLKQAVKVLNTASPTKGDLYVALRELVGNAEGVEG